VPQWAWSADHSTSKKALEELLEALPRWANKTRTFEEDMALEISDAARLLVDSYAKKAARLMTGDFSAPA